MTRELVVLGGNFGGIIAAKAVLENVNPKLKDSDSYHVTLISSSTHAYFNLGAPRLLVEPEKTKDTFFPVTKIFSKFPKSQFTFIHGTVTSVDFNSKKIFYNSGETVTYDALVIATGARTQNLSYKLYGSHEETIKAIKDLNSGIASAKTIAIGGGGPTGVETAGELAFTHKDKKVVLYTGGTKPLENLAHLGNPAEKKLANVGVKVINNVKIESSKTSPSGQTILKLSDGTESTVDIYIPVIGLTANTGFLDKKILDDRGFILIDDYLRVKGYDSVYAIGDVCSGLPKTVIDLDRIQKGVLKATLLHDLVNKNTYALSAHPHPTDITIAVPISRNGGVGVFKGWGIPNFLIRMAKAKDFMIPKGAELLGAAA